MTDPYDSLPTEALTRRSLRGNSSGQELVTTAGGGSGGQKPRGIAAVFARHPTAWLLSSLSVAFLLLGTGALAAGISLGASSPVAAPTPTEEALPPRTQPAAVPAASRVRTCSISALAADPRLSSFTGFVANATTGETLFDRAGAAPQRTGSVLTLVTAAAAVSVLGADARLATRVVDGSSPGTIVLVGGGDPTLATAGGNVYDGAPELSDLATQVLANYKALYGDQQQITTIVLDATLWNPVDRWDTSWPDSARTSGYQAPVTALMVNGDRDDATAEVSPRSADPVARAGQAFADELGLETVTFITGSAAGSTLLGQVQSQPVSTLVEQMLMTSDYALAEALARLVSKGLGLSGSSASIADAIPSAMTALGLDSGNIAIRDGSGLSELNGVSPQFVTQLLVKIRADEQNLGIVYSGMPVGGESGDLYDRFSGANEIAAGAVVALPGSISSQRSLAGIIAAADGTGLVFAFFATRDGVTRDARDALDDIATAVYTCGDNLSNN